MVCDFIAVGLWARAVRLLERPQLHIEETYHIRLLAIYLALLFSQQRKEMLREHRPCVHQLHPVRAIAGLANLFGDRTDPLDHAMLLGHIAVNQARHPLSSGVYLLKRLSHELLDPYRKEVVGHRRHTTAGTIQHVAQAVAECDTADCAAAGRAPLHFGLKLHVERGQAAERHVVKAMPHLLSESAMRFRKLPELAGLGIDDVARLCIARDVGPWLAKGPEAAVQVFQNMRQRFNLWIARRPPLDGLHPSRHTAAQALEPNG